MTSNIKFAVLIEDKYRSIIDTRNINFVAIALGNCKIPIQLKNQGVPMKGQMCWLSKFGNDGEKILYLRLNNFEAWTPYTAMPKYSVPDYKDMPDGSKGWATFQKLLRDGWKIVHSETAYKTSTVTNFPPEQMAS